MGSLTDRIRRIGRDNATPTADGSGVGQVSEREQAIIDRNAIKGSGSILQRLGNVRAQDEISVRRQQRDYAEQTPSSMAQITIDPAREMVSNLGDRAKVLDTYRKMSPEQREEALKLAPGIAQQLGDDRGGVVGRTLGAISRGVTHGVSQPAMELMGLGGTPEEIEYIRQLDAAASQEFSPARPGDPWYERGPLQATEMAPWMATVVGGAGVGRTALTQAAKPLAAKLATKAGAGRATLAAAGKAGELAGITVAAFPGQYAQEVDSLKELGMEDNTTLRLLAGGTAAIAGLIEGIVPNPFKTGQIPLTEGAVKAARQYLWEAAKKAPGEMSEEYLQGVTSGLGSHIAQYLDENAEEKTIADAFKTGWEQAKEAALPMAFLLGVPAVGGAGLSAARAQRLARLQEISRKGFVSAEDAKSAGIEGKNRKERMSKAVDEIKQLEEEATQADSGEPSVDQVTPAQGATDATQVQQIESPAQVQGNEEVPVAEEVQGQASTEQGEGDAAAEVPVASRLREEFQGTNHFSLFEDDPTLGDARAGLASELVARGRTYDEAQREIAAATSELQGTPAVATEPKKPIPKDAVDPKAKVSTEKEATEGQAAGVNDESTPRRGEVGGKLADGEVVTTSSGRQTTPFPKLTWGSDRKAGNTLKRVDRWLHDNAVEEARSRGDDFNLNQFEAEDPAKMPPASKDAMEEYLFGEKPEVIPPATKTLTKPAPKPEPATQAQPEPPKQDPVTKAYMEAEEAGEFSAPKRPRTAEQLSASVDYFRKLFSDAVERGVASTPFVAPGTKRKAFYEALATEAGGTLRWTDVGKDQLSGEFVKQQSSQEPVSEPQRPPAKEQDKKPSSPSPLKPSPEAEVASESNWQSETRAKLASVPALKDASIEADEQSGTVKVTRQDGLATTIHFNADESLAEAAKEKGRNPKSIYGRYVRKPGASSGEIYIRSDANHTNILNHEVMHWLEDTGVVTKEEVEKYGGREAIANKYGQWASIKQRKKDSVFGRIRDAIEPLFSAQQRFFEGVGKRTAAKPQEKKTLDKRVQVGDVPGAQGSYGQGTVTIDRESISKMTPDERAELVRHELAHQVETEEEFWSETDDYLWRLWESDSAHPIFTMMGDATGSSEFGNDQSPEIIAELYSVHYPKGTFTADVMEGPYADEDSPGPKEWEIPKELKSILDRIESRLGIWGKKEARKAAKPQKDLPQDKKPSVANEDQVSVGPDAELEAMIEAEFDSQLGEQKPAKKRSVKKEKAAKPETRIQKAAGNARKEADDLWAELNKASKNKLTSGLDPELAKLAVRVAIAEIKAETLTFAAFVEATVSKVPADMLDKMKPYMEMAWSVAHKRKLTNDPAGKFDDYLKETSDAATDESTSQADKARGTGDRSDSQDATSATDAGVLEGAQAADDAAAGGTGNVGGLRDSSRGKVRPGSGKADSGRVDGSKRGSDDRGRASANDSGAGRTSGRDRAPKATRPNYHLTDPASIIGGGPKAKFERNRKAIEIVRDIEETGRAPTAEDLDTLAGYTGWGAFGQDLFKGSWENSRPSKGWEEQDEWLRIYLGEEDWKSAQQSIVNAHYTDPQTVTAMWGMLRRMGFDGGRVLEPSLGIGNFFSLMPRDLMEKSTLTGIELDTMTAKIATILHPQANIQQKGYQESQTPDNFYDVILSNVPFGNYPIADRRYKQDFSIHNYFFKRAFDQVKPGGVIAFLTSNTTMDGKTQAKLMRAQIAEQGDLVTAVRLPSGAFQAYAGTKVVADLIVIRKRKPGESPMADQEWIDVVEFDTPAGEKVPVNEYWEKNSQNILGTMTWGHGTTSGRPGMIVEQPENLQSLLDKAAQSVPEGVINTEQTSTQGRERPNTTAMRQNSVLSQDDDLWIVKGEQLVPLIEFAGWYRKGSKKATIEKNRQEVASLLDVREAMRVVLDSQAASEDATEARSELNRAYDAFVAKYGPVGKSAAAKHMRKAGEPTANTLLALEEKKGDKYIKRPIFDRPTVRQRKKVDKPTVNDAFAMERNRSLDLDIERIASAASVPAESVVEQLESQGKIYKTGTGGYDASDVFLSGNMARKLRQLQAAQSEGIDGLERSIEAVRKRLPEAVPYSQIEAKLGATWVEASDYSDFLGHLLNEPSTAIQVERRVNGWKVKIPTDINNKTEAQHTHGHRGIEFNKLMNAAMNNATVKLTMPDPLNPDSRIADPVSTAEANAKIGELREKFSSWIWTSPERITRLSGVYNEEFNSTVTPEFDDVPLLFEGMTLQRGDQPFNLRKHQESAVWRGIVSGKGIFAHEVGTGKTLTMAAIAMESRRLGLSSKPLLLAHNANSMAVRNEIQEAYPNANILYVDNLDAKNKDATLQAIATENWDLIVVPHSMAERFQLRPETVEALLKPEMDALEAAALEAFEESDSSDYAKGQMPTDLDSIDTDDLKRLKEPTAKELVKERLKLRAQIDKAVQAMEKGTGIAFEDMGIDMVMVDEAHLFKKLPITTKQNIKGLNKNASQKGTMLMMLADYVRSNNNGRGVYLFSGTPITNTINEVFNMMRFVMAEEMESSGVRDWDGWFNNFATQETLTELSSGGTWENFDRLSSFVNLPELRQMVGQYMDIVFAEDMPEFHPRDKREGRSEHPTGRPYKQVHNVTVSMIPAQEQHSEDLKKRYTRFKNAAGKDKVRMMREPGGKFNPLVIEGEGVKLAMDPRLTGFGTKAGENGQLTTDTDLLDPKDQNLKINRMLHNAMAHYHEHPQSSQMIFMQVGHNDWTTRTIGRTKAGKPIRERARVFNLAREIKRRLLDEGVPESEIALFSTMSKERRTETAQLMREGKVRFAIGSTETMGTGVNAQDELIAMHHLDAPWMPGDLEQRNGRGHRQGNKWNTVKEYRYLTEGPQDGRRWQVLLTKSRFIEKFMKADGTERTIEMDEIDMSDDGTGSDMEKTFAAAAGDPRIMMRIRLEDQVSKLQRARDNHSRTITETVSRANDKLKGIKSRRDDVSELQGDYLTWLDNRPAEGESPSISLSLGTSDSASKIITGLQEINDALKEREERYRNTIGAEVKIGDYRGVPLFMNNGALYLGKGRTKATWSIASLQGLMANTPERMSKIEKAIEKDERFVEMAHKAVGEPFPKQKQLDAKQAKLDSLLAEMEANPDVSPAWLRAGAPVGTAVYLPTNTRVRRPGRLAFDDMESELFRETITGQDSKQDVQQGQVFTEYEVAGHRSDSEVLYADGDKFIALPAKDLTDKEGTPLFPDLQDTQDNASSAPVQGKGVAVSPKGSKKEPLADSPQPSGAIDELISPEMQQRKSMGAAKRVVSSAADLVGDYEESPGAKSMYASPNEEFEKRYQAARRGVGKRSIGHKLASFWNTVVKSTTRGSLPELPRTQQFGEARSALHAYQAAPQYAAFAAKSLLGKTVKPLSVDDFDLFTRTVILRDLNETEGVLPFGLDHDAAASELERLESLTASNPEVQAAIEYRNLWLDGMKEDYIAAHAKLGIDVADRLNRENYFRHQVLFYHQVDNMQRRGRGEKRKADVTLSRDWLKKRRGSELDINANYFQAEWQVATQMIADTQRVNALARIKRKYDIKPKLDAEAKGKDDVTWRDFVPEGHQAYAIRPGRTMFRAFSIPEQMAQELLADMAKTLQIDGESLRPIMAMGSEYAPIVIPDEVASQMEAMNEAQTEGLLADIDSALTGVTRWWKRWVLQSPRRAIKYNIRNLSEVDKVVALNPKSLRKIPQAVKELWGLYSNAEDLSSNVRDWVERGGASSLVRVNEIGELDDLKEFARLVDAKQLGERSNVSRQAWRGYWDKVGLATDFRESILRYAAYLEYLEQIEGSGSPGNYGGSVRSEVDGITDPRDKAMRLSSDLLGDYSDISVLGQWLRMRVFPFWSFQETNARAYYRGVQNLASDEQTAIRAGLAVAKAAGVGGLIKTPFLAYKLGRIAILFYGAKALLTVVNRMFFADDDDELPEDVKRTPHLTLGRDSDGNVLHFSRLGTSSDVLDWIGLDSIDYDVKDVLDGRRTLPELANDMAMSTVSKGWNAVTPLVKVPGELVSGVAAYPRVDRPRQIRDRGEHVARLFGLEHEYKLITGKPTRGYRKSWLDVVAYRTEPGLSNYYSARDMKYRWSEKETHTGKGYFTSDRSNALFNYKQAIHFGDKTAAARYLEVYGALGGTEEGVQSSLNTLHPMAGLSVVNEVKFLNSLTPTELEQVREAERFMYEKLMTPEQAESLKESRAKREGVLVYQASGEPDKEGGEGSQDEAIAALKSTGRTLEESKQTLKDYWEGRWGSATEGIPPRLKDGVRKRYKQLEAIYKSE